MTKQDEKLTFTDRLSKIGIFLSAACAIHCVLMPFIIVSTPLLGLTFFNNKALEYAIIIPGATLSSYIVIRSYRYFHHSKRILSLVLGGFFIMLLGHLTNITSMEAILSIIGALFAGIGLYFNIKATHQCVNHTH